MRISSRTKLKILGWIILVLIAACTRSNDKPPKMDSPIPPAHDGIYISKDARFTFNGDGKTVLVSFSEAYLKVLDKAPNDTEYRYLFTWDDFGEYRYDGATQLILVHEESNVSLKFNLQEAASFETIKLAYPISNDEVQVLKRSSE